MLRMVSYSRRPQSGQITCYLNRTYHVLLTPLCDCPGADGHDAQRSGARATANGVPGLRTAAGHADGSWHAVVESGGGQRMDGTDGVADAARDSVALRSPAASADAGQGGTVQRSAGDGPATAGAAPSQRTAAVAGRVPL